MKKGEATQPIHWGISPIGWRNDDMPELGAQHTLGQVLSEIALAGFEGTEVGGFFPPPDILLPELRLRGLSIAGQWFSSYLLRDGYDQTAVAFEEHCLRLAKLGARVAVVSEQTYSIQRERVGVFRHKPSLQRGQWSQLCAGLEGLGEIAEKFGLFLAYHPHLGTVVQTSSEIDELMARTDPKLVYLLYDTGHAFASDEECLELAREHGKRIRHVHFKDVRYDVLRMCKAEDRSFLGCVLQGLFTVPGDGCIDFKSAYEALIAAGYEGWIVVEAEQDPSKAHPLEYALKARDYIQRLQTHAVCVQDLDR
ncbi:myo-inosose-2 dehydratase [Alicyclobacillus sendaiensis]|uniref:Myo-inosose-2 dehydratase n=1 Tax=Alicyclobacillus sendaiensis PA2 TaxID=3029425 RepID=A0ABT6Y1U1_ALISE|nr:myo-inosose-2 dehydratase [Alicyclobacillus sendaiensis]MDI9261217.1 myo-inosose-2 dehydratase [Alicyclobacillus sendaiensis PA2]